VEVTDQRRAYYNKLARQQLQAYDSQFKAEEQHPMPIHEAIERRTQVQFGTRQG
jgi:hypothetical protein